MSDDKRDSWFVTGPWFSQPPHGDGKTPHWVLETERRTIARFHRQEDAEAVIANLVDASDLEEAKGYVELSDAHTRGLMAEIERLRVRAGIADRLVEAANALMSVAYDDGPEEIALCAVLAEWAASGVSEQTDAT
jgi:hypothetical protein